MDFIEEAGKREETGLEKLLRLEEDQEMCMEGAVHSVRDMGEIGFVILRKREGLIQTVWEEGKTEPDLGKIREGDVVRATGTVRTEERSPHGRELCLTRVEHLSHAACPLPLAIDKWKLNTSLEAKLDYRSLLCGTCGREQFFVSRKDW